jgi:hypothetical protein
MATATDRNAVSFGTKVCRLGLAAFALSLLLANPVSAQNFGPGPALELFEGPRYTGRSVVFTADDHNLINQRFNDAAMSARLIGGDAWEVCVDAEYRGGCVRLDRDEPDLGRIGISRAISSVRLAGWRDAPGWEAPPFGRHPSLILFSHTHLHGQRFELTAPTPNFSPLGFNDQAQSLVARGRWLVCVDANYAGWCEEVEDEVWDLNALGLSRRISSARPLEVGWRPSPRPPYGGGLGQSLRGRSSAFYPAPLFDGRPAPACLSGPVTNACAQRAADAFCRSEGYGGARYFITDGRGRNAALLDVLCVQ